MMQLIIGLKIESYKSFAECAKVVRQFQNYSISELKKRIDAHDYILCHACTDDVGVKNVIKCYYKLTAIGVTVSLYELGHRPTTFERVCNRDRMYDEMSAEVDIEDNGNIISFYPED